MSHSREFELMKVQQLTLSLPLATGAIQVLVRNPRSLPTIGGSRIFRWQQGLVDTGFDLDRCKTWAGRPEIQAITSDVVVDCSEPAEGDDIGLLGSAKQNGHADGRSLVQARRKKGVLIQMATGPHQEFLEITLLIIGHTPSGTDLTIGASRPIER